jgi:hypothetical protein
MSIHTARGQFTRQPHQYWQASTHRAESDAWTLEAMADMTEMFTSSPEPSVADMLVEQRLATTSLLPGPTYDTSDSDRRVSEVTLTAFRGSPATLRMDFLRSDRAVSAIVLGDNGVGKSTLVDAIEFGLQGRIGRSVSFDSPLAPAAASLARDTQPSVVVQLDDGSTATRTLDNRADGKLYESGDPVRPGFRLAPITLKRQDILRFLDTDALARGHVFFDYFPASAEEMAVRPEELLRRLADREYELRVLRRGVSAKLASVLGVDSREIEEGGKLQQQLKERFTGGTSLLKAVKDESWAKVAPTVRIPAEQLLNIQRELSKIKKARERGVQTLNPVVYRAQANLIAQVLDGVGAHLTSAFREISGAAHVTRIDVVFGGSGPVSLDVVVELASGRRCFPQQIFSEGYRDLLAILFFAVLAQRAAASGQAKVLILDDVFQSVDATVRSSTIEFLLREFKDWQLILTVHDRLWFEQLRNVFRRHNHVFVERELRRWTFEDGPALTLPGTLTSTLERDLVDGDPASICASAGRLLEQACDQLSGRLGSSVIRRRDDKYTLGDLWPGVRKAVRQTSIDAICNQIDELYSLRNLTGAHYNEWAEALSLHEAQRFGEAVLSFVRATWCPDCHDWVGRFAEIVRCPGGHRHI